MRRLTLAVAVLCAITGTGAGAEDGAYRIVVHSSNPGTVIKRTTLASIFLKQSTRWGHGLPIEAVDQSSQSPVRARFVREVIGETVPGMMNYWGRQISTGGQRPPLVKSADADVLAFVQSTPGAIGYVSEAAPLPASVKTLRVE